MSNKADEGSSVTKRPKRFITEFCFWRFYWQAWQLSWKAPYTSWKRASSWFLCQYYWNFRVSNSVFYMTNGWRCTVWKFHNFTITQILREINFGAFLRCKMSHFSHLETLSFDFCEFLHFLKAEIHQNNKIHSPKNCKKQQF